LRDLHYLGGHPAARAELEHVDIAFDAAGIHFARRREPLGSIAWVDVTDLAADADTTTSRMTVPRVWLLGIYALLFKKHERRALLRIQDRRGAWLFTVDGIALDDLRDGLRVVRARYAHWEHQRQLSS
jgi:hypothetical protein